MVPSLAPGRYMVARSFPVGKRVCGRRDLNPHERLSSADFLTVYGFRRPGSLHSGAERPGLRSGLSLHHARGETRG